MNDCGNTRVRDLLPELLHGRLAPGVRAEVGAHVDACSECRAELELLRRVRAVAGVAPAVDAARIAAAVPPYRARPAWRRSMGSRPLQVAAALVLIAGSLAVATFIARGRGPERHAAQNPTGETTRVAAVAEPVPVRTGASAAAVPEPDVRRPTELALGESLTDLSESELRALLEELEALEALTPAEPEVVLPSLGREGDSGDDS